jgi:hypothetical protein
VAGDGSRISKGPRQGLTFSRGGVPLMLPGSKQQQQRNASSPPSTSSLIPSGTASVIGNGRGKKRKHYPNSWGCAPDQMKMKKRVLCVYDGQRRLWKDEMMLDSEFEIRMKLSKSHQQQQITEAGEVSTEVGGPYVTDLDVATLKRANALLDATDEEKGPWRPEGYEDGDLRIPESSLDADDVNNEGEEEESDEDLIDRLMAS